MLAAAVIITKEKRHCEALSEAVACLTAIRDKAVFYAEPLQCIAQEMSKNTTSRTPDYIAEFLNIKNIPTPKAWETAVRKSRRELTDKERELIILFGSGLCTCSREQIPELCGKIINELDTQLTAIKEKKDSRIRLTSALSLSVGITAVLILI